MLDLIVIHDRYIRLGSVIWAAVGKDPGYSPGGLISEIRRNARYRADDYADLELTEPVDAGAVACRFRDLLDEADAFVRAMPVGREGLVFLKDGAPVEPDPANLAAYVTHSGKRPGHWPSTPDVNGAMIEHDPTSADPCRSISSTEGDASLKTPMAERAPYGATRPDRPLPPAARRSG